MGMQPIIELFSPQKSWPNSRSECTQYNPLFSPYFMPNKSQLWMNQNAISDYEVRALYFVYVTFMFIFHYDET